MAYTTDDLDAIKRAISSGELTVSHNGRTVTYRSINDLLKAKADIEGELNAGAGNRTGGSYRFNFQTLRGE
ncbi:phage head-tail joining protein [Variovorax sp. W2I14]|uniref:phage head-tail joining protein n=1 Tax=Variovorax sp. W2I14 TaxID=3042290 RepID=UPI003D1CA5A8